MALDLALTYDALHQIMARYMADFGLSKSTYNVLMLLRNGPEEGMQLHDLGEMLIVSRANITGLIDSLEERGWVRRLVDETDRRVRYAQITPSGEKLLDEFAPVHFQNLCILMQGLNTEEKDALARLLEKMRQSLATYTDKCARHSVGTRKRSRE
ncbi:MAG: MarR family winged helix-turn-helix transcriptional regulator [Bryobacteraceae bacterium]